MHSFKYIKYYEIRIALYIHKVGSLKVGKYADLVILEKNLFDLKPTDIADVKVMATMMDGKFTYESKEAIKEYAVPDSFKDNARRSW